VGGAEGRERKERKERKGEERGRGKLARYLINQLKPNERVTHALGSPNSCHDNCSVQVRRLRKWIDREARKRMV